ETGGRVRELEVELEATSNDLAKTKSHSATLSADLESTTSQLSAAQSALSAASSTPAAPSEDFTELQSRHASLTASHEASQRELAEAKASFAKADSGFGEQIDAMQSIHDQYLKEKEEEHVVVLQRAKKEFEASRAEKDEEVRGLKERLALAEEIQEKWIREKEAAASREGGPTREDIENLHQAHSKKMAEVEAAHKAAFEELQKEFASSQAELDLYRAADVDE
ncbi:hypothetical protein P7C70_g4607, partial [Phenoliferia sp. Uapishka_3]